MSVDLTRIKPYGDTMDDGVMQLSFTLPVPNTEEAKEAARILAKKMGLDEPSVVEARDLGVGYTFFVMYGKCTHTVDYTQIEVVKVDSDVMEREEVEEFCKQHFNRDIVIVGACSGTDAHTVGIDAIMNMKGYHGHYGLERYHGIKAINLGAQVPNEDLIAKAVELNADAIIISQIVTQKDVHIHNMSNFIELMESEGLRDKMVVCAGGPRVSHELAKELGFDAGFGTGTYAEDVASFIVQTLAERGIAKK